MKRGIPPDKKQSAGRVGYPDTAAECTTGTRAVYTDGSFRESCCAGVPRLSRHLESLSAEFCGESPQ